MQTKYKTLTELENIITQYVIREIRFYEESKKKKPNIKKTEIINNIYDTIGKFYNDELIKEIIDIICEEGNMTEQEIVDEFNNCNNEYKYYQVSNIYGLYKHCKTYISARFILIDPVNHIFTWYKTKRGHVFFSDLNKKVMSRLKLNTLFKNYLSIIK